MAEKLQRNRKRDKNIPRLNRKILCPGRKLLRSGHLFAQGRLFGTPMTSVCISRRDETLFTALVSSVWFFFSLAVAIPALDANAFRPVPYCLQLIRG